MSQIFLVGFTGMATWEAVLYILCGLGIFLYGINMMGGSLRSLAGNKMSIIIEKTTNTPLKGMLVGFIVTMLTQSASGTSALAVSLVAAGLMTFPQALGILLGANIGGTILTIILAAFSNLKIMPIVSVILVFIGAFMVFFFKKKKIKQLGSVVLGFGFIFLGLSFIDMSFKTILSDYNEMIVKMFEGVSKVPVLGVLIGTIFTFIVQSSSATIGIVQSLYSSALSTGTEVISLSGALAIMLGANIGTTITAFLASLGSSKSAKKVATANILIKFFGVLVFTIAFSGYLWLITKLNNAFKWEYNEMIIAIAHLLFNIVNSFAFLFLLNPLTKICNLIIKGDDESDIEKQLSDYTLIKKSPALALDFVGKAINYMADLALNYFKLAYEYSFENNPSCIEKAEAYEHEINGLDKKTHDYLIKLTEAEIDKDNTNLVSKYLDTIKDLERIGDHCTNLVGFFSERYEANVLLSKEGIEDLSKMYEKLNEMVESAVYGIKNWDKDVARIVIIDEEDVDSMEEIYRKRHIERLTKGICTVSNLDYYVDILSNLERIGDHTHNIANNVINDDYCQGEVYNH